MVRGANHHRVNFPIHLLQHEIQNDQIKPLPFLQHKGLFAARRRQHLIPFVGQDIRQALAQSQVIFDDEQNLFDHHLNYKSGLSPRAGKPAAVFAVWTARTIAWAKTSAAKAPTVFTSA